MISYFQKEIRNQKTEQILRVYNENSDLKLMRNETYEK